MRTELDPIFGYEGLCLIWNDNAVLVEEEILRLRCKGISRKLIGLQLIG